MRKDSNKKMRTHKWHQRNTKDCKKILWITVCQQIGWPRQNDKFLETYNLLKLNQEESENMIDRLQLVKLKR